MKRLQCSDEQVAFALRQLEGGTRSFGVNAASDRSFAITLCMPVVGTHSSRLIPAWWCASSRSAPHDPVAAQPASLYSAMP